MLAILTLLLFFALSCRLSPAQSTVATGDSRTVTEPAYPSSICARVKATKYLVMTNTVSLDPYGEGAGDISGTFGVAGARGAISFEASSSPTSYVPDESSDLTAWNAAKAGCAGGSGAVELTLGDLGQQIIVLPRWAINSNIIFDPGTHIKASRRLSDYAGGNCGKVVPGSSSCAHWITSPNSDGLGLYGPGILEGQGFAEFLDYAGHSFYTDRAQAYCNNHGGAINGYFKCTVDSEGKNSYGPNGLDLVGVNHFTLYDVTIKDSGNFSTNLRSCQNVTVWGMKVFDPFYMSNTDGIDPLMCKNVTITHSYIANGDNSISIKSLTGTPSQNITISFNQLMGIGTVLGTDQTGGINNILVTGNVTKGNLLNPEHTAWQIGSSSKNGGPVDQITFENGCSMDNTIGIRNYTNYGGQTGTSYPDWTRLLFRNLTFLATLSGGHSGKFAIQGLPGHSIQAQYDNIWLDGSNDGIPSQSGVTNDRYASIYKGPGPVPSSFVTQWNAGTSISQSGTPGSGTRYPCSRSSWKPLVGEMFLKTPTSNIAKSYNNTSSTAYTVQAVLQPTTDINMKESRRLTKSITFLDNGVPMSGTVTMSADKQFGYLAVPSPPAGPHTYSCRYPGDSNYAAYTCDSVVTVTNPGITPPPPPPPGAPTNLTVILVQ